MPLNEEMTTFQCSGVRVGPNHKESEGEAVVALGYPRDASCLDQKVRHALAQAQFGPVDRRDLSKTVSSRLSLSSHSITESASAASERPGMPFRSARARRFHQFSRSARQIALPSTKLTPRERLYLTGNSRDPVMRQGKVN